ncbi:F510_1955 family glycosylhydrolase [Sphaerisporangium viridialbum]|uniref:F510_1955 family glycosylhydrolase n=1 Tax=Sphaerisporangium viridialbum TaxID=46189 RepID=UPI003C7301F2
MDPGIGHVHGLGMDPSDGAVYIAAHNGLFQIRSKNRALRVADRVQDYMGFTVAGPGTFLASGHPSAADIPPGGSPHLGLIRSADAGVSWTPVSLAGQADFHALQLAGTSLYGYDSQTSRVYRSTDTGRTWTPGAQLQVIDLAADPAQPDRVYATTPDNLLVSNNAGNTFQAAPPSPPLVFLESPGAGQLIGVVASGEVRTSRNAGRTWQALGNVPDSVSAFTALDSRRLLAATDDGAVYQSRDGGKTFTPVYQSAKG